MIHCGGGEGGQATSEEIAIGLQLNAIVRFERTSKFHSVQVEGVLIVYA